MTTTPAHDSPASSTRAGLAPARRRDLQGIRAVAVLMVVLVHAGLLPYGGISGVDVFFALSGFVITLSLSGQLSRGEGIDVLAFFKRRILRLLPAISLVVTVSLISLLVFTYPSLERANTPRTAIGAMLMSANVVQYRHASTVQDSASDLNPLKHTWSLSVEEQFYLVLPVVLILGWWLGRNMSRRALGIGVLVVGMLAVSFLLAVSFAADLIQFPGIALPDAFAFYSSLTRAWELAVGVALALAVGQLSRRGGPSPAFTGTAFATIGACTIAVSVLAMSIADVYSGVLALGPVVGTAALILGGYRANPISTFLSTRPMVWIGDLSYSWYLWHWPFIVFATLLWPGNRPVIVLVAAVSIIPAWLSYRFVEKPIRYGRAFRTPARLVLLVSVCVGTPLALALGLLAMPDLAA